MTQDSEPKLPKNPFDDLGPALGQAAQIAHEYGLPLLCVTEGINAVVGQPDMAVIGAHLDRFSHPLPLRFLKEFYAGGSLDPKARPLTAAEKHLIVAFCALVSFWHAGNEEEKALALGSAMVLVQRLAVADEVFGRMIAQALAGTVGAGPVAAFGEAMDAFTARHRSERGDLFVPLHIFGIEPPPGKN